MSEPLYYIGRDGRTSAPSTAKQIIHGIRSGRLEADALVCPVGGTAWTVLGETAPFAAAFAPAGVAVIAHHPRHDALGDDDDATTVAPAPSEMVQAVEHARGVVTRPVSSDFEIVPGGFVRKPEAEARAFGAAPAFTPTARDLAQALAPVETSAAEASHRPDVQPQHAPQFTVGPSTWDARARVEAWIARAGAPSRLTALRSAVSGRVARLRSAPRRTRLAAAVALLAVGGLALMIVLTLSRTGGAGAEAKVDAVASVGAPVSPPPTMPSPPSPPSPSSPADLAETALGAGRYEEVCAYLVAQGFSSEICDWIVATARSDRRSFSASTYERFLRAQHVRRVSGRIVRWWDEGSREYEVRMGSRTAILACTETTFARTVNFSMWAQAHGTNEGFLYSGRAVTDPIYREWPLYGVIRDAVAAARAGDGAATAIALLRELLRAWVDDYCYVADPDEAGFGECWVEAPPAATAELPPVSAARRRDCREFICFNFIECRRAGLPWSECSADLTRDCRNCRDEGAVP